MGTLVHEESDPAELANPARVKVVCRADGRALYFSRAIVPFDRDRRGTARYYKPHSIVRATVRAGSGTTTTRLRAGALGRITVSLPLGPGNPDQEYSPAAAASGTAVYAAKVTLRALARRWREIRNRPSCCPLRSARANGC